MTESKPADVFVVCYEPNPNFRRFVGASDSGCSLVSHYEQARKWESAADLLSTMAQSDFLLGLIGLAKHPHFLFLRLHGSSGEHVRDLGPMLNSIGTVLLLETLAVNEHLRDLLRLARPFVAGFSTSAEALVDWAANGSPDFVLGQIDAHLSWPKSA